jgi:hypothetical protein
MIPVPFVKPQRARVGGAKIHFTGEQRNAPRERPLFDVVVEERAKACPAEPARDRHLIDVEKGGVVVPEPGELLSFDRSPGVAARMEA